MYVVTIEDVEDEDYAPPKRRQPEPPSPTHIYDAEGNEIDEPTEHARKV